MQGQHNVVTGALVRIFIVTSQAAASELALLRVGLAVAVRIGVEVVGDKVAVCVAGALLRVGLAVAVRIGVEVVGDAVTVMVSRGGGEGG